MYLFSCVLFVTFLQAQDSMAYVQIISDPGVSVFLDNVYQGKTLEEFEGLIIDNITAGEHKIKCVKESYLGQESTIILHSGEVFTYELNPLIPKLHISQSGHTGAQVIKHCTQNLKIQSLPVNIQIKIPALGVNSHKTADIWKADNVPCGEYTAEFIWHERLVTQDIMLEPNNPSILFVNMLKGEVVLKENKLDAALNGALKIEDDLLSISLDFKDIFVKIFIFSLGLLLLLFPALHVYRRVSNFSEEYISYISFLRHFRHYFHRYRFIKSSSYYSQSTLSGFISFSMIFGVVMVLVSFYC